jgi:serine/threonine protein kinase
MSAVLTAGLTDRARYEQQARCFLASFYELVRRDPQALQRLGRQIGVAFPEQAAANWEVLLDLLNTYESAVNDLTVHAMFNVYGYYICKAKYKTLWSIIYYSARGVDGHMYALKTVPMTERRLAGDPDAVDEWSGHMWNELTALYQCSFCPHIVPVRSVFFVGSLSRGDLNMCIVEPLCTADLHRTLAETSLWTERRIVRIALSITEALMALHSQGFCHLDIKPANVLVGMPPPSGSRGDEERERNGGGNDENAPEHIYLCDFGLALRVTTQRLIDANKVTLMYRPPELMTAVAAAASLGGGATAMAPVTAAVDMWSLGALLWELVAQVPLVNTSRTATVTDTPENNRQLAAYLTSLMSSSSSSSSKKPLHELRAKAPRIGTANLSHAFVTGFLDLVAELLALDPAARPAASLVWLRLSHLVTPLSVTFPVTPPRTVVGAAEMAWRGQHVSLALVSSWWRRMEAVTLQMSEVAARRCSFFFFFFFYNNNSLFSL